MTALIQSAQVGDNALTMTLTDGDNTFDMVIHGLVKTALQIDADGYTSVEFTVSPRLVESAAKPLNEPPVNF